MPAVERGVQGRRFLTLFFFQRKVPPLVVVLVVAGARFMQTVMETPFIAAAELALFRRGHCDGSPPAIVLWHRKMQSQNN
jgi:hypothetical protein